MSSGWRRLWQLERTLEWVMEGPCEVIARRGESRHPLIPHLVLALFHASSPRILTPFRGRCPHPRPPEKGPPFDTQASPRLFRREALPWRLLTPQSPEELVLSAPMVTVFHSDHGSRSSERAGRPWWEAAGWHQVSFSWPSNSSTSGFVSSPHLIEVSLQSHVQDVI